MQVKVLFFGVLEEVTGTNCKYIRDVRSISDLKLGIQDDFPELVHYDYSISLNNVLKDNDPLLNDGDVVAFMHLLQEDERIII